MNTNLSKQLEILNAYKDGAIIQVKHRDNNSTWCDIKNTHIFNFEDHEYRIKPKQELPTSWREYCNNNTETNKFFINSYSHISECFSKDNLNIFMIKICVILKKKHKHFLHLCNYDYFVKLI